VAQITRVDKDTVTYWMKKYIQRFQYALVIKTVGAN
jgi:hypothetical protein